MKKIILWLIVSLLSLVSMSAQDVFEQDRPMSLGLQPAHVIDLPLDDVKAIEKLWDDYMKELGIKLKRNRKADEYYIMDAELYSVGQGETFEQYSRVEEKNEGAQINVWVHFKDGFLTKENHPEASQGMTDLLLGFEKLVRIEKVKRQIEEEEKTLKDLGKELDDLVSDKEKYEERIEDAKREIKENEQNIEKNIQEQEVMKNKIEDQKMVIQKAQERIEKIKAE